MAIIGVARTAEPLECLLNCGLVRHSEIEQLPYEIQEKLKHCQDVHELARILLQERVLTDYQASRVEAGWVHGLVLGPYRVLHRLSATGTKAVYKGEHAATHQPVVIKVLSYFEHQNEIVQQRFLTEMHVVAELRHPNIVAALDSGHQSVPGQVNLRYFVMEYVPGQDLEEHVKERGPLPIAEACGIALQLAAALAEACKHQLVHRELTPANVRLTPHGQVKLLNFGRARNLESKLTEHGTVLGNPAYMAPEQATDAVTVDSRADIYGLGATLFWCLTGQPPFPRMRSIAEEVLARRFAPAP